MRKTSKQKTVVCHDIQGKLRRLPASRLTFRPSAYGILIERNKVLLSRQWGGYDFPGGGIELHETIEQALQREYWEETGLRVTPLHIIHAESSFFTLPFRRGNANCVLLYFLVKKIGGSITTRHLDQHERKYAEAAEWVPLTKINKLKFYNPVDSPALIRKAAKMRRE